MVYFLASVPNFSIFLNASGVLTPMKADSSMSWTA